MSNIFGSKQEIKLFRNEELDLQMRTFLNEDGSISVNAEDTAIGFGWVQEKNGKTYVKWERLNEFCKQLDFSPLVEKETYIPESLYYLLAMKANNRKAQKFQRWLAMEVIPEIRKTGSFNAEQTVTETETSITLSTELIIRAGEAMAGCLEGNRPYVLNILRHIIPDIGDLPKEEPQNHVVETKVVSTKKTFYKQGIKINTDRLIEEMKEHNITPYGLSRKTDLAYNTIINTMGAVTHPTQETLDKICLALGCTSNYLKKRERRKRQ